MDVTRTPSLTELLAANNRLREARSTEFFSSTFLTQWGMQLSKSLDFVLWCSFRREERKLDQICAGLQKFSSRTGTRNVKREVPGVEDLPALKTLDVANNDLTQLPPALGARDGLVKEANEE